LSVTVCWIIEPIIALQNELKGKSTRIVIVAFDLLCTLGFWEVNSG
jgi:hypothetical protein